MHSQDADDRTLRTLWGVTPTSTRGPRPRFSVEEVASVASELADAEGLASVSLARVAARLQLTTTALYRYVDSKDTLVELMIDRTIGPPPDIHATDWRAGTRKWVHELWQRYSGHLWLTEVQVRGMPRHPNRLGWMDALLRELDRGDVADPMHVALLLDSIARAFALFGPQAGDEPVATPPWLTQAVGDRYPRLARELARDWDDVENELDRAVETVLSGAQTPSR